MKTELIKIKDSPQELYCYNVNAELIDWCDLKGGKPAFIGEYGNSFFLYFNQGEFNSSFLGDIIYTDSLQSENGVMTGISILSNGIKDGIEIFKARIITDDPVNVRLATNLINKGQVWYSINYTLDPYENLD